MANVANLKALDKGLVFYGQVEAVPGANQFTIPKLAEMGASAFVGWTAFVFWDAAGLAGAPQAESKAVTVYTNAGVFTTSAFTAAVAVGDHILLLHPTLANLGANLNVPAADATTNANERDVIGNKTDAAVTAVGTTKSLMAYLKGLIPLTPGALFQVDFWSVPQEEVAVTAVAGDLALPDVTVAGLPTGSTVVRAVAMFKARVIENTNGAVNKLNGAQEIQVRDDTPGAWADAINFVDDQFGIAASTREGGDVLVGALDLSATVDGNDTYNFQWDEAVADQANLQFNDVQVGLRIWYRV